MWQWACSALVYAGGSCKVVEHPVGQLRAQAGLTVAWQCLISEVPLPIKVLLLLLLLLCNMIEGCLLRHRAHLLRLLPRVRRACPSRPIQSRCQAAPHCRAGRGGGCAGHLSTHPVWHSTGGGFGAKVLWACLVAGAVPWQVPGLCGVHLVWRQLELARGL